MDSKTLSSLHEVFKEVQKQQDWKAALDKLFGSLRGDFVFDNVVIYFMEPQLKSMDVVYARALGRGKGLEADVSWGENFAHEVITKGKMISKEPVKNARTFDRFTQAYLLGFPISIAAKKKGAIVFVRFGGPSYSETHTHLAALQSFWASAIMERKDLNEARTELDSVQRQMRLQDDFEKRVMTRYPWVRYVTCYNHAASDASTREVMRKSMASYRERGAQVAEIEFNVDYTGGIPDGRPSRAPGVYVTLPTPAPQPVPQTSSAPAQPAPATAESEIRRREAAADAELARYLYSKQQAEEARRAAERQQSEARYAQQVAAHADQVARQRQRAAKVQA